MTAFNHIMSLKPQPSDNDNRITIEWEGNTYSINQQILKRYNTADELKNALDKWTQFNLGYTIDDIWFHINRDGTWVVATGINTPSQWPEDMPIILPLEVIP